MINFHGLFRNDLRCRKTGACRILVPLRYTYMYIVVTIHLSFPLFFTNLENNLMTLLALFFPMCQGYWWAGLGVMTSYLSSGCGGSHCSSLCLFLGTSILTPVRALSRLRWASSSLRLRSAPLFLRSVSKEWPFLALLHSLSGNFELWSALQSAKVLVLISSVKFLSTITTEYSRSSWKLPSEMFSASISGRSHRLRLFMEYITMSCFYCVHLQKAKTWKLLVNKN